MLVCWTYCFSVSILVFLILRKLLRSRLAFALSLKAELAITIFLSCSRAAWTAISQRFAVIRATCWTSSGIPSSRTSSHPALKTLRWGTFSSIYPSIFLDWFNGLSCRVAWLKPANGSCGTPLATRSPTGSHDLSRRLKSQSPFALISAFDVT